ncbi:hypothetical protein ACLOJK_009664 [Asimina triloba]
MSDQPTMSIVEFRTPEYHITNTPSVSNLWVGPTMLRVRHSASIAASGKTDFRFSSASRAGWHTRRSPEPGHDADGIHVHE